MPEIEVWLQLDDKGNPTHGEEADASIDLDQVHAYIGNPEGDLRAPGCYGFVKARLVWEDELSFPKEPRSQPGGRL